MNSALQLKWVRIPSACFIVQNRETHTEYLVRVCVTGFADTVEWTVSRRFSQFYALVRRPLAAAAVDMEGWAAVLTRARTQDLSLREVYPGIMTSVGFPPRSMFNLSKVWERVRRARVRAPCAVRGARGSRPLSLR